MMDLRLIFLLVISCSTLILCGQCTIKYISNDTVYQDYIEFIYPKKNADEIITIGSRINRGVINDSIFNAPIFRTFDYCGSILKTIVYKNIGQYKLRHVAIPTHNTYKEEPVGNTATVIEENEFLLVDKAIDTVLNEWVLILLSIDKEGLIKNYKTTSLSLKEGNQAVIKNVLKLKDGKFLVILWDYFTEYVFFYFDENFDFLFKKSIGLGRGMRSLKEIDNGDFICTSLAYDNSSFQFYRLDTVGNIKWIVTPYNMFGSARDVLVDNNKIYITGSTNIFGAFLIYDLEGNILSEFKYDTFNCKQRFCSAYLDSDDSFIIGGYIEHCQPENKSGRDIAIIKINSNGKIIWNELYDFKSALGTADSKGYYNDQGGFVIAKTNDGGIITNGMSRYNRSIPGGVLHEDALLVKSEPIVTNTFGKVYKEKFQFELLGNLISCNLSINGPLDLIKNWVIYSFKGEVVLNGKGWTCPMNLMNIESGMYAINIMDQNNYQYFFKFVKI